MKNCWLSGVSIVALGLTTSAQAADLAARAVYKAPAAVQKAWSWTGFYVGANVGVANASSSVSDDPGSNDLRGITYNATGNSAIGGIQFGYNWQIANVVLGVEGDVAYTGQNRSLANIPTFTSQFGTFNSRLNWLDTVRARAGFAFDRVLVYGTGGVAFASVKDSFQDPAYQSNPTSDTTRTGWTAGVGVEYAVSGPWTVRVEYLHVGLPNKSVADPVSGYAFAFRDKVDIGRTAVSYKF